MPRRRSRLPLLVQASDDADAFAAFYDAYAERVLVFLMRRVLVAEVALDLTAETFAQAFERRRQFRGDTTEAEQGWLFAIARSELSHYWRRGATERAALGRLGVPVPTLTDADIERIEELADLRAVTEPLRDALEELPPEQAEAVRLRVVDELSYDEISRTTGADHQLVRARVSRGLRRLADTLEETAAGCAP